MCSFNSLKNIKTVPFIFVDILKIFNFLNIMLYYLTLLWINKISLFFLEVVHNVIFFKLLRWTFCNFVICVHKKNLNRLIHFHWTDCCITDIPVKYSGGFITFHLKSLINIKRTHIFMSLVWKYLKWPLNMFLL